MRKLVAFAVLSLFVVSAHALTITNPFYMQGQGQIMSDTQLDMAFITDPVDVNTYILTEEVSYGITDRIQVGANIGYALVDPKDFDSENDFVNPEIFGYYRLLNDAFNLDLGARITLGLFDNDITAKDYAYAAEVRAYKAIDAITFGGKVSYVYNDPDEGDSDSDVPLYVYGLYNFNEKLAAGLDLGYSFNAIGEDYDTQTLTVRAIGSYEFQPEKMGLFAYVGYTTENTDNDDTKGIVGGAQFKIAF